MPPVSTHRSLVDNEAGRTFDFGAPHDVGSDVFKLGRGEVGARPGDQQQGIGQGGAGLPTPPQHLGDAGQLGPGLLESGGAPLTDGLEMLRRLQTVCFSSQGSKSPTGSHPNTATLYTDARGWDL